MSLFKFYTDNKLPTIEFYIEWFIEVISNTLLHSDYAEDEFRTYAELFEYGYSHTDIAESNVTLQIGLLANSVIHEDIADSNFATFGKYTADITSNTFEYGILTISELANADMIHRDFARTSMSTISYTPKDLADLQWVDGTQGTDRVLSDINESTLSDISSN